jgi:hypothetical protein
MQDTATQFLQGGIGIPPVFNQGLGFLRPQSAGAALHNTDPSGREDSGEYQSLRSFLILQVEELRSSSVSGLKTLNILTTCRMSVMADLMSKSPSDSTESDCSPIKIKKNHKKHILLMRLLLHYENR